MFKMPIIFLVSDRQTVYNNIGSLACAERKMCMPAERYLYCRKGIFIMAFIDEIKAKAKADKKKIVLPEGMDRRIWEAAVMITQEDIADLTVIATQEDVEKNAQGLNLDGIKIIDPVASDKLEKYINDLTELRRRKGMTPQEAKELLTTDYILCMHDAEGERG